MQIADATDADLEEIVAIYNDAIVNSTAVFSDRPVTVEHQRRWLSSRIEAGQPVIVARVGDMVAGFGSYGPFRSWPGYRLTVEHSVYVHPERRRQGVGRELVRELLQRARRNGIHVVMAGIDADNGPSLRLHEQLGFQRVGLLPEVARKFDRWLDLVLMQLTL